MFSSDPTMDYGLWQGRKCTFDCYFSRKSAFLLQRYHMVVTASVTVKVVNGRAVAARCCLKILCIALVPRPDTIPSIPLITSTVQHPSEMPFWFKIAFFAWQSTLLGESLWAELVNDRAVPAADKIDFPLFYLFRHVVLYYTLQSHLSNIWHFAHYNFDHYLQTII